MKYLAVLLIGLVSFSYAEKVTYTTYNNKKAFIQHWKLTEEELKRYDTFMDVEGKYRYPNLTPLEVLGIAAETDEQRQYYAKKAAQNERDQVKKQLKFILLTTEYKKQLAEIEHKNDPEYQKFKAQYEQYQKELQDKNEKPDIKELLKKGDTSVTKKDKNNNTQDNKKDKDK
ncbi:MAG: hypothetical protein KGV56_02735 [Gammaproteobacteria bacterium]|nr:hypothetical protein [Gammaproteobacteria bacterium]